MKNDADENDFPPGCLLAGLASVAVMVAVYFWLIVFRPWPL